MKQIDNSQIRAKAREALGNSIFSENWLLALVAVFIMTAIISAASSFIPFAAVILTGPLTIGLASIFLKVVRTGEKIQIGDEFKGFNEFGGNVLLGFMISLFTFLWSLLLIIPGIVKYYAYSMAYYIKLDNPEYTWKECIEESKRMTNGYKAQLFCLDLSFIGWLLLGTLCCGIGTLWVTPYMEASHAAFYNELKGPVFEEKQEFEEAPEL